jgi:yeast amino acid transporter
MTVGKVSLTTVIPLFCWRANHQVFNFLTGLSTTGLLINYAVICATYIRFRKACLAQGIKRVEASVSPLQPVLAWYGLCWSVFLSITPPSTMLI